MRLEQQVLMPEDVELHEVRRFYCTNENPMTTFTDKQLERDNRNRLSTALFEAGLLDTDYARNLIAQLPGAVGGRGRPALHENSTMMSSAQLEAARNRQQANAPPPKPTL